MSVVKWDIYYSKRHYAEIELDVEEEELNFKFLSAEAKKDGLKEDIERGRVLWGYDPRMGHSVDTTPHIDNEYDFDLWIGHWIQEKRNIEGRAAFRIETKNIDWAENFDEIDDYEETGIVY